MLRRDARIVSAAQEEACRSAAGAESTRTRARPAACSRVWNSWDLASVATGFVRIGSSRRSLSFSLSLQHGLPLGHQPLPLMELGELELAQRRATTAV